MNAAPWLTIVRKQFSWKSNGLLLTLLLDFKLLDNGFKTDWFELIVSLVVSLLTADFNDSFFVKDLVNFNPLVIL